MFQATIDAFGNLLDPTHFLWLILGVAIGWWVGIIPGIGSLVGVAVILPFLYGMDPVSGLFLLIGIFAVNNTSDTFPAVIFGIPGGASSAATIMDGHPLAKKGQAGRALGAAFTASMIGGIVGALVLVAVLPLVRPLVLSLGSPELLALTVLGLLTVGIIARGVVLLGVVSACVGLALATIGTAPAVIEERFTFGTEFLQDGLSVVIVAVGLFGVPELLHLLVYKTSIAQKSATDNAVGYRQLRQGARDTFRNTPLVVGSGALASFLAIIPGVGGSVITWIVWSLTGFSKKNKVPLGQGEIRGVIGPESANNATDGGQLVPTLFFGVPGSGGMAILLAGMTLMGVGAGPRMLEDSGLVLVLSIVIGLCAANILGTLICFGIARWVSRLTDVPGRVIVPFLMVTLTLACFQGEEALGFLFIMLALGVLGWIMLIFGVPRVPVLVGFVLGDPVERYLWISVDRYGASWLWTPKVLVIFGCMVAMVVGAIYLARLANRTHAPAEPSAAVRWR
ncbi:tripartite tricarboxylate transporter permease [Dactylosporangium sp. AC04546]|uniref:tripartite tricarboxylate transporter permease n=1 Tax=Dactylosporangium sp. AC04546 TaxID=2862460 RepID=UPI001EDE2441|nr:tripartite tricarboxylate transporter permease [Dactylosporangium sp. AC04546]WVK79517.1 tripartite tricarboxylate transporter permease [Dactylosporangium sp. AC04546]